MYAILGRAATHEDSANASWLVITDDDTLLRYDIFGAVVHKGINFCGVKIFMELFIHEKLLNFICIALK